MLKESSMTALSTDPFSSTMNSTLMVPCDKPTRGNSLLNKLNSFFGMGGRLSPFGKFWAVNTPNSIKKNNFLILCPPFWVSDSELNIIKGL